MIALGIEAQDREGVGDHEERRGRERIGEGAIEMIGALAVQHRVTARTARRPALGKHDRALEQIALSTGDQTLRRQRLFHKFSLYHAAARHEPRRHPGPPDARPIPFA
ncbi:MAG: hypothetical protein M3495_05935 [Pseudomonadota bacterium]|nr:hypothetical protein [Pseudomonadota bacterium]